MSNFIRFKTIDGKVVYIRLQNIFSVERGNDPNTTKIISVQGGSYHLVMEHVEEVIARIEGRDPSAASILFGDKGGK